MPTFPCVHCCATRAPPRARPRRCGRLELQQRTRWARPFTSVNYTNMDGNEPVAINMYPVTSAAVLPTAGGGPALTLLATNSHGCTRYCVSARTVCTQACACTRARVCAMCAVCACGCACAHVCAWVCVCVCVFGATRGVSMVDGQIDLIMNRDVVDSGGARHTGNRQATQHNVLTVHPTTMAATTAGLRQPRR
jgi:hypothetical protein